MKMTQKQLVEQLKMLKEIKPRKEWAILLKSQILFPYIEVSVRAQKKQVVLGTQAPVRKIGIWDLIENWKLGFGISQKLAYAFAVVLFLIVGVFGFASYTVPGDLLFPIKKIAEQSQAALTGQTGIKQNVATLGNRINDLAQVARAGRVDNIPSAISEINAKASDVVKDLRENAHQDKQTIKEIAISLKTLADVPGTDLTASLDVKDLYQTVVQSQIDDLKETTLAEGQAAGLSRAEDLYNQGKYTEALEEILLIDNQN